MAKIYPSLTIARHGQTPWTITGQHTGLRDLNLTEHGREEARRLGRLLAGKPFANVWCSPLQRARETCEIAGYSANAVYDSDLVEWHYGDYEGKTRAEIEETRPGWKLFRDGCPNGESLQDVVLRARRVVEKVKLSAGDDIIFSSGHFLRVLAAVWCEIEPIHAQRLVLNTSSVSVLGYEGSLTHPAILLWNQVGS